MCENEKVHIRKFEKLVRFNNDEVLPENSDLIDSSPGGWLPIYYDEIQARLIQEPLLILDALFKNLYQKVILQGVVTLPKLFECGSGLGMIGALASLSGFQTYNIEIQRHLHNRAVEYGKRMVEKKIIDGDKVHYVNASYYTASTFAAAKPALLQDCQALSVDYSELLQVLENGAHEFERLNLFDLQDYLTCDGLLLSIGSHV